MQNKKLTAIEDLFLILDFIKQQFCTKNKNSYYTQEKQGEKLLSLRQYANDFLHKERQNGIKYSSYCDMSRKQITVTFKMGFKRKNTRHILFRNTQKYSPNCSTRTFF